MSTYRASNQQSQDIPFFQLVLLALGLALVVYLLLFMALG